MFYLKSCYLCAKIISLICFPCSNFPVSHQAGWQVAVKVPRYWSVRRRGLTTGWLHLWGFTAQVRLRTVEQKQMNSQLEKIKIASKLDCLIFLGWWRDTNTQKNRQIFLRIQNDAGRRLDVLFSREIYSFRGSCMNFVLYSRQCATHSTAVAETVGNGSSFRTGIRKEGDI